MLYRCKACRAPLFRDCNVLDHLHPILLAASDSVFASFSRHGDGSSCCSSVFTEPLDWLGIAESGQRRAKVTCPGKKGAAACGSKLGAWSLEGANCSCGRMVKPAIQFTLSRVECVKRN
ncbi:unnamed protein product [Scytosiphon promiscuus]